MVNIELLFRTLVHDKDGKLIQKTEWKQSRSLVFQFLALMNAMFRQIDGVPLGKDVTGTDKQYDVSYATTSTPFKLDAPDDNDVYGIVVGSGITAEDNEDYALATKIAHGSGAGQLDYGVQSFVNTAVVGANVDLILTRTFVNSSGATVEAKEIGVITSAPSLVNTLVYLLIIRDVLPATVEILNTQTLTVQYTKRTTV